MRYFCILLLIMSACSTESLIDSATNELAGFEQSFVFDSAYLINTEITNDGIHQFKVVCEIDSTFDHSVYLDLRDLSGGVVPCIRTVISNKSVWFSSNVVPSTVANGSKNITVIARTKRGFEITTNLSINIITHLPVVITPSNQQILYDNQFQIGWNMADSASGCILEVSSNNDFSTLSINENLGDVSSYSVPGGLLPNGVYYVRLKSKNGASESGFSLSNKFEIYNGSTVYVSTAGSDSNSGANDSPKRTIQAGINLAKSLNITNVKVAGGTYATAGPFFYNDKGDTCRVLIDSSLHLVGGFNGDFTSQDPQIYPSIIDGANFVNSIISIDNGPNVVIDGLVLLGANGTDNGGGIYIGTVVLTNYAQVLLKNCLIVSNKTRYCGGGIYLKNDNGYWDLGIYDSVISDNQTRSTGGGGGGLANNGSTLRGKIAISNCRFNNNSSWTAGGGIISWSLKNFRVIDSIFSNNKTIYGPSRGGALNLNSTYSCGLTNNIFIDNSTVNHGGAIYCHTISGFKVVSNTFSSNNSFNIYMDNGHPSLLINNQFLNMSDLYRDGFGVINDITSLNNIDSASWGVPGAADGNY